VPLVRGSLTQADHRAVVLGQTRRLDEHPDWDRSNAGKDLLDEHTGVLRIASPAPHGELVLMVL
jgi:hypothetical protein